LSAPHPRPWHRESVYGDGPRCPRDRNQRARFKYLLEAHGRAGRLPAKQERVGLALLRRLGTDGQCDPGYDTLAEDARCSARTARRATATMRDLGLLYWQRRIVRAGWRAEQTSNAYTLIASAAEPAPPCAPRSGGQNGRETRTLFDSPLLSPQQEDAAAFVRRDQLLQQLGFGHLVR